MPYYGWISKAVEADVHVKAQLVEASSCPQSVQLVNTRKAMKNNDPMDIVELAASVQKGDQFVRANAGNKLRIIADQIRYLQEQAKKVLEEAQRDSELNHAACNIVKKPGTTYYLYLRPTGQRYFSMLSPQEWGAGCPHDFLGAYKLETDMSWTPAEHVERREQEFAMIDKVLSAGHVIQDSTCHLQQYVDTCTTPQPQVCDVTTQIADTSQPNYPIHENTTTSK